MAAIKQIDSRPPDGIAEMHAKPHRWSRHASPLAFIVFGALVLLALSGLLGGHRNPTISADTPAAVLSVNSPRIIRNGELFETRIAVEAKAPIADLVVALPPSLWRDLTINSMIPAASEEEFADGLFRFHYGPFKPGERIEIKVANQINPALFGGTRGHVAVYDDALLLAQLPVTLRVLP